MSFTPGSWRTHKTNSGLWTVRDSNGHRIAAELDEGTACLIVRAVNAHDELLEAAKFAQDIVINSPITNALTAFQRLSAAIAKAEDREP